MILLLIAILFSFSRLWVCSQKTTFILIIIIAFKYRKATMISLSKSTRIAKYCKFIFLK